MRNILDTNILVSALIVPGGAPDYLYQCWRTGRFTLVSSEEQLNEFRRVTRYPRVRKYIQPAAAGTMLNEIRGLAAGYWNLPTRVLLSWWAAQGAEQRRRIASLWRSVLKTARKLRTYGSPELIIFTPGGEQMSLREIENLDKRPGANGSSWIESQSIQWATDERR